MANVLFSRTSDPSSKPITDGQLVFDTSGNGKMYLDNGTERLEMGGSMSVDSVLNAESTNPIQNKAVAGVMLKTLDEVGAVTKAGFIPDALTVKQLNSNLTNESDEQFVFGVKDGVRGFYTNPSRADDCFIPFSKFKECGVNFLNYEVCNMTAVLKSDGMIDNNMTTSEHGGVSVKGDYIELGFPNLSATIYAYAIKDCTVSYCCGTTTGALTTKTVTAGELIVSLGNREPMFIVVH